MSEALHLVSPGRDGYSVAEAAEHFGVTPRAVRRYIERGQLPAERIHTAKGVEWRITSLELRRSPADSAGPPEDRADLAEDDRGRPELAEDLSGPAQESEPVPPESPALLRALELITEKDRRIADLEESRFQLAGQLGFYQAQLQAAHEQIKLLSAPKEEPIVEPPPAPRRPWWRIWG